MRGLIVVLWRAGVRIHEALALTETDLNERHGSLLSGHGKDDRRHEMGMDPWDRSVLAAGRRTAPFYRPGSICSRAVVRTLCAYGVGLVERARLGLIAAASSGVHLSAGEAAVLSGDAAHEQTEHNGQHGSGEDDVEDQDEGHWALPWSGSGC
jgi:hypothetical protein